MVSLKYPHLAAELQHAADLPTPERLAILRSARWIGYRRALEGVQNLEDLYAWPRQIRMPNMLIVGLTNSGKSLLVKRFMRGHRPTATAEIETMDVVSIQMPAVVTVSSFFREILDFMSAPYRREARAVELQRVCLSLMRATNVRILIIDEFHNMLGSSPSARIDILNLIRFIGNDLQIPIVAVGTPDVYFALRTDPQLENRFRPFVLPRWEANAEALGLLDAFQRLLPLRQPSNLATEKMCKELISRSEGTIGELSRLLEAAATVAIRSGSELIDEVSLAAADYMSPSTRHDQYGKML